MSTPPPRPEREEQAMHEVGETAISTALARFTALLFLAAICLVPLIQAGVDCAQFRKGHSDSPWPNAFSFFEQIPQAFAHGRADDGGFFSKLFAGNRYLLAEMEHFEDQLEEDSFLTDSLLGPVQQFLTKTLQAGNEQAYPGVDGWLFYRPDIDYVTHPGFLRGSQQPVDAVLDFHQQLKARGITLILLPTPVKPSIQPERYSGKLEASAPILHNASYEAFIQQIQAGGVQVMDPGPLLKGHDSDAFLETDTHWTFAAMDSVAAATAQFIQDTAGTAPGSQALSRTPVTVTNHGDIAAMLKLPEESTLYPPQVQVLQQVLTRNQELVKPDPEARVLVLGDSFSNIFSLEGMGWGESAGFAEQLSYHLQQPVDAILQNDAGSFATRRKLATELARGRDRLAGKQVVLWQFAVRELAQGHWEKIPLELGEKAESSFYLPRAGSVQTVTGTVTAISSSPKPGTVPYKDNIVTLHLSDLLTDDAAPGGEALLYAWGMQENRLTDAARLRPGDEVEVQLSPWSDVEDTYSAYRRTELMDIELELEEPCWAISIKRR